jgi:hypothetical protein
MNKMVRIFSLFAAVTAALVISPMRASAEDTNKTVIEKPKENQPKTLPFHGVISSIDKKQITLTVGERTFQITSATRITKHGKPAIFDDAAVGDHVGGSYKKSGDKLDAVTINLDMKQEKSAPPQKPSKPSEKPSGEM